MFENIFIVSAGDDFTYIYATFIVRVYCRRITIAVNFIFGKTKENVKTENASFILKKMYPVIDNL